MDCGGVGAKGLKDTSSSSQPPGSPSGQTSSDLAIIHQHPHDHAGRGQCSPNTAAGNQNPRKLRCDHFLRVPSLKKDALRNWILIPHIPLPSKKVHMLPFFVSCGIPSSQASPASTSTRLVILWSDLQDLLCRPGDTIDVSGVAQHSVTPLAQAISKVT